MRINSVGSYGRTALIKSTMQDAPIRAVARSKFMTAMELQEMTRKDSSNVNSMQKKAQSIDFGKLVDAILKSGDLSK